jgi:hypothetical protein
VDDDRIALMGAAKARGGAAGGRGHRDVKPVLVWALRPGGACLPARPAEGADTEEVEGGAAERINAAATGKALGQRPDRRPPAAEPPWFASFRPSIARSIQDARQPSSSSRARSTPGAAAPCRHLAELARARKRKADGGGQGAGRQPPFGARRDRRSERVRPPRTQTGEPAATDPIAAWLTRTLGDRP